MTFSLPKEFSTLVTPTVLPVELNDTDVDRMITRVLEMAVKQGRTASSRVNANEYDRYLDALRDSGNLVGFDGEHGRDLLDGWVRASIVKEERAGLRRDTVQMGYLRPLTIATYRSGLPKTSSRNRKADVVAYQSMIRAVARRGSNNPPAEVRKLFVDTFGTGVELGEAPWAGPRYDGETEIDIDTLLALRFLEGFEGSENLSRERSDVEIPIPQAVDPLGEDLIAFLRAYGPSMPVAEAYGHVSAIIALRLFQLPLVSAVVARRLLSGDASSDQPVRPEMYCDFTRRRGGASDETSKLCVMRDLEVLRAFFADRLLLRALSEVHPFTGVTPVGETAEELMRWCANSRDDQRTQMALGMRLQQIFHALDEDSDGRAFINEILGSEGLSPEDRFVAVLVEGLRKRGLENQIKWFHTTGGITKNYGVLSGTLRVRSTWRYAPSDEVLTTLLCMCFVDSEFRVARSLPIRVVLERLESRFGLIIDRPPAGLDSGEARAGAADNLEAFTRRLKLLGCFEGLSDDFSAQYVTRPREAA
ncbi:hypothetical protein [Cellulomonas sp. ICMP 17802]|uniref:hypothetical protein n=1 Tax=Cellulomonas sp. ICMP 17802 TaxID=3239199 RepID=UPI00351AE290